MPTIHSYMTPLELIFMSENANAANFAHPARLQVRQDSQVLKHFSNVSACLDCFEIKIGAVYCIAHFHTLRTRMPALLRVLVTEGVKMKAEIKRNGESPPKSPLGPTVPAVALVK